MEITQMVKDGTLRPDEMVLNNTGKIQQGTNEDGTPHYIQTFTVVKPGQPQPIGKKMASYVKQYTGQDVDPDMVVSGLDYNHFQQRVEESMANKLAFEQSLQKAGIAKHDLDVNTTALSPDFQHALNIAFSKAKGNLVDAEQIMQNSVDPTIKQARDANPNMHEIFIKAINPNNPKDAQDQYGALKHQGHGEELQALGKRPPNETRRGRQKFVGTNGHSRRRKSAERIKTL